MTAKNSSATSRSSRISTSKWEFPCPDLRVMTAKTSNTTPRPNWNTSTQLKFPGPVANHDHEVRKCKEFFDLSPRERWEKLKKIRMCYSCLTPKTVCKGKKCTNVGRVPKVLKCAVCASWAESKGLALFSIVFCKQKIHEDS